MCLFGFEWTIWIRNLYLPPRQRKEKWAPEEGRALLCEIFWCSPLLPMFTDGRIDHFQLFVPFRSALHRSRDWYRYVSTRYLRLFNDSYGGFAPRTYHRFSLIAFISYLGRNAKLVLRITTEQKSSTAIRIRTSCYWDSFDFIIHQHPPLPIHFLC